MSIDRPGRMIVLEGGDGAGRSTQIRLLLPWLQSDGWAPLLVGLGRCALTTRTEARLRVRDTSLSALALVYAADLEDQASGAISQALDAGFTVIADRWVGTALARCAVRGADLRWLLRIFPVVPKPDLIIHLHVPPRRRLEREIAKRGRPTWTEAGRDLYTIEPLRSFIRYQALLDRKLSEIGPTLGPWCTLDGDRPIAEVQRHLRKLVSAVLHDVAIKEDIDA